MICCSEIPGRANPDMVAACRVRHRDESSPARQGRLAPPCLTRAYSKRVNAMRAKPGGSRALEAVGWATLSIPDHTIPAGNRACSRYRTCKRPPEPSALQCLAERIRPGGIPIEIGKSARAHRSKPGGSRALETAMQATLSIPDHTIPAGNRACSDTGPASGLRSRRPSNALQNGSGLEGPLHICQSSPDLSLANLTGREVHDHGCGVKSIPINRWPRADRVHRAVHRRENSGRRGLRKRRWREKSKARETPSCSPHRP